MRPEMWTSINTIRVKVRVQKTIKKEKKVKQNPF